MTETVLIQAWIDYIRSVIPEVWTITRAEQTTGRDAPRPSGPYITLKISAGPTPLTLDDELRENGEEDGEELFDLVGQRSYTLALQAFRAGHKDILSDIQTFIDDPDKNAKLKSDADIAVTNKGNVIDISSKLETGFEGRSSLDIFFNSSNNKTIGVGSIESTQIDGKLKTDTEKEIEISLLINKE